MVGGNLLAANSPGQRIARPLMYHGRAAEKQVPPSWAGGLHPISVNSQYQALNPGKLTKTSKLLPSAAFPRPGSLLWRYG